MPMDDDFEWHAGKARSNYGKHGVTFKTAKRVFADPFMVEVLDDSEDYDEERYLVIGMVEGQLLSVVYTPRQDRFRLISARAKVSKTTTSRRTTKAKSELGSMRPMTDAEVLAAARSDPDAKPFTSAQLARMKHTPRAKLIRRARSEE